MTTRPLRIIRPEEGPAADMRLRALFAREDALLAELADVRAEQREARNEYASERRLLILPGMTKLREVLRG